MLSVRVPVLRVGPGVFGAKGARAGQGRRMVARAVAGTTPGGARDLLAEGHAYLDVRTPEEYGAGHVPGAKNCPFVFFVGPTKQPNASFLPDVAAMFPDKDTPIVVGCKSGARSTASIGALEQAGYTNLINLDGGFDAWVAAGLKTTK